MYSPHFLHKNTRVCVPNKMRDANSLPATFFFFDVSSSKTMHVNAPLLTSERSGFTTVMWTGVLCPDPSPEADEPGRAHLLVPRAPRGEEPQAQRARKQTHRERARVCVCVMEASRT